MNGQSLKQAFVPLPARATAVYNSSGLEYYRHADWLGSSRLTSTPSRTVSGDVAYAPFGETYAASGSPAASFTGQNADTDANLYDFMYREYGIQGRWPSPDPSGPGAAFDLADPQSLNRYAYVLSNPTGLIDPLGLWNLPGYRSLVEAYGALGGGVQFGATWNEFDVMQIPVAVQAEVQSFDYTNGEPLGPPSLQWFTTDGFFLGWADNRSASLSFPGRSSWWGTFAKNFFGNFVSLDFYKHEFSKKGCLTTFVSASVDAANPASGPGFASAGGAGTMAVSATMRYNAAQAYAASRTNSLGGQGLIFPQKSKPYNRIFEGDTITNLAEGALGYVDGAMTQGLLIEYEAAINGTCH